MEEQHRDKRQRLAREGAIEHDEEEEEEEEEEDEEDEEEKVEEEGEEESNEQEQENGEQEAEEEQEQENGEQDDQALPVLLTFLPAVRWKRQRQLMREALGPSGAFEDLCCVVDGYLGKMEVSELRCVRTIGSNGDGAGQLQSIGGISVDAEHIATSNFVGHRVSLFDKASGAFIRKFGSRGDGQGQFKRPSGVCLDSGNVYVCDFHNRRVQVLTKDGAFVRFIGDASGDGKLHGPIGVSVDAQHVVVSNHYGHRMSLFDKATGAFIRKVGSPGNGQGQFFHPTEICIDGSNVYVCDHGNKRVQVLTKEGVFVRFIGDASGGGKLNSPQGVAVDEQHVFVADSDNKCVKVFGKQDGAFVRDVKRAATDDRSAMRPYCLALSDGVLYATEVFSGKLSINECITVFEG